MFKHYQPKYNRRSYGKHWRSCSLLSNVLDVKHYTPSKLVGKSFSKYELFSLDPANFNSVLCQILILQYSILRDSLPPSLSLSSFTLANCNPSSTQSSSCIYHHFPYFILPYSNTCHNYWIYQIICQAKPIKFIIKLYANHNILLVKHASYQKVKQHEKQ